MATIHGSEIMKYRWFACYIVCCIVVCIGCQSSQYATRTGSIDCVCLAYSHGTYVDASYIHTEIPCASKMAECEFLKDIGGLNALSPAISEAPYGILVDKALVDQLNARILPEASVLQPSKELSQRASSIETLVIIRISSGGKASFLIDKDTTLGNYPHSWRQSFKDRLKKDSSRVLQNWLPIVNFLSGAMSRPFEDKKDFYLSDNNLNKMPPNFTIDQYADDAYRTHVTGVELGRVYSILDKYDELMASASNLMSPQEREMGSKAFAYFRHRKTQE